MPSGAVSLAGLVVRAVTHGVVAVVALCSVVEVVESVVYGVAIAV